MKKTDKQRYPISFFLLGFFMNAVVKNLLLFFGGLLLLLFGIWRREFLLLGAALLFFDLVYSLVRQLRYRYVLMHSTDPSMVAFRAAICSKNWKKNVAEFVQSRMNEGASVDGDDGEGDGDEESGESAQAPEEQAQDGSEG